MAGSSKSAKTENGGDLEEARSERRFRLIAEAIPHIVWTTRPDGYCDYQNRRWTDYSGLSAEESAGIGWMEAVHPDDRELCNPAPSKLPGTDQPVEFEYRLRRADGEYRWFVARAEPIYDDEGKVVRWFGTSTDIHDRKRLEDEVRRKNHERLKLAATAARLGYWDWDLTTDTITWSDSLENLSGTTPEDFGLSFENFLGLVHPDDRDQVRHAVMVAVEDGTPYEEEFRLSNPDGSYRWGLAKGQAYFDDDGRPIRLSGIEVDITRRKAAEQALEEAQRRDRRLADHSPAGLYIFDIENRKTVELRGAPVLSLGYTAEEMRDFGDQVQARIMHPEDLVRFAEYLEVLRALPDQVVMGFEYRMRHADGSWRWFLSRDAVYERDQAGTPRLILGAALDVTDRRRWQDEIRSSEEKFRAIFDNAAVGIAHVGLDGRWLGVNDRLCEILGRDRQELLKLSFQEITHPDDLAPDLDLVARLIAGEIANYRIEKRYLRKDGTLTWANLTVGLVPDREGQPDSFISVIEQIDDRKLNEDRLKLGMQVGGLAIAEIDYASNSVHLSPEALEMFGLDPGEPVVPRDAIHALIHPDDRPEIDRQIARLLDPEGDGRFAMVHRIIRPDREVRWYSVQKQASFGQEAGGRRKPIRSLMAMRDVTDTKWAEQELKEADRRKDEFLAILAHEFRNPLSAIRNSIRLLGLPGVTEDDRASALEVADRQSQNLVRLIDDLLDVSRISTGKIQLQREPLDAARVVANAAASTRPFLESRRHELIVDVAADPMPIEGDATRLEQILTNLLNNAGKYTNEGGRIHLDARVEAREVVIRVQDNGLGIDSSMLSKVFELFEQVDSALDRSQGGLGIGLTLVKRLAELHGGRVSAISEGHGRGSEFTLRLPLLEGSWQPAERGAGEAGDPNPPVAKSRRILLVDDNPDTIRGMSRLLEISGHQVVRAVDGLSAIEAARRQEFDFMILDIGLPGMSGYQLAETLLRDQLTRATLIALSGYAQDKDRDRSRLAGFTHHLSKPVDLDSLLALIDGE